MRMAVAIGVILVATIGRADDSAELRFVRRVLPLLREKCFACHGQDPADIKGALTLTTRAGHLKGGESGEPAVHPGQPETSPLMLSVIRASDNWSAMPPKENDRLSPDQVAELKAWIEEGATWPTEQRLREIEKQHADQWAAEDGVVVKTSGGLSPAWTNRRYKPEALWAYQPLKHPEVKDRARAIDELLEAAMPPGLTPAPLADRRTLIRRATFDVIGLPPTPDEIASFLNDPADDATAFATVVDRLLASPHFGEQMARRWLDVTRYADSSGLANDYERGNAWRYRDYVVRAFNSDKPYDQFVREQIAGDEIDPDNPENLVATGFLRMGAWELTGMEVPKIARQRFLDDVTDGVGQVFLAHMLQCARCHDHKFDPVPTRDYYGFQACFATTQLTERPASFLPEENVSGFEERKYLEARRDRLQAELDRIRETEAAARQAWKQQNPDGNDEAMKDRFLSPVDLGLSRITRKGIERLKWQLDRYEPVALSVYSGRTPALKNVLAPLRIPKNRDAGELEQTHILPGGDPFSPSAEVVPCVLTALGESPIPVEINGRRTALARWITSPDNPLTSRVMVNRLWQWTFGKAIAGNPNNFGATGKRPTHPELLDWLAGEFQRSNGSTKQMLRAMFTSEAYRRSSRHPDPAMLAKLDPAGDRYAAFQPRRLSAEELRDAMLAVSGELNRTLGGIPIRPEMPADVAMQPRMVMGTFAAAWEPSPRPEQRHRRSLYILRLRGLRDPFAEVFNQPSPESSCEAREESTVAPQALSLMNGDDARGRAVNFAVRLLELPLEETAVIEEAFRWAYGRSPSPGESTACLAHWKSMTERHETISFDRPQRPTTIEREASEEVTGEKFRFAEVLESAADFIPDRGMADVDPRTRGLAELCLVLMNANEFVVLD
ncbi:Planctomycete cytochrome C [Caulifigura coniformis]|uniref:Planctomycete cytochrome C n=1 Tax=Caulifigura coniformis TaxID=2527983 RepID=A0A517SFR3_9PLAN|nr:PSD1 and planctomycete cytochrome C domain-containing protein [Caulifigura coniformis]QDT54959.1 Planctomycete cytochrome C [Caulifigura coniformis]